MQISVEVWTAIYRMLSHFCCAQSFIFHPTNAVKPSMLRGSLNIYIYIACNICPTLGENVFSGGSKQWVSVLLILSMCRMNYPTCQSSVSVHQSLQGSTQTHFSPSTVLLNWTFLGATVHKGGRGTTKYNGCGVKIEGGYLSNKWTKAENKVPVPVNINKQNLKWRPSPVVQERL